MLQLELGQDLEARIAEEAQAQGITPNAYVRDRLVAQMPRRKFHSTLEQRQNAVRVLSTFAKDRGIDLPPGVTIKSLIEEGRP